MACAPERRVSDAYAHSAVWYDPVTARALAGARARVTALCREKGWQRVLDLGCGTGLQMRMLHAAGIAATGLDASSAMLAQARKSLRPACPLVQAQTPLVFADNSFDAVILSLVLHETEAEPERLLRDALRVAPVCLVLEWRMPERNLDLPGQLITHAIERLAGTGHYRRFRAYAAGGWLRGLASRAGARIHSEEAVAWRALTLAVLTL